MKKLFLMLQLFSNSINELFIANPYLASFRKTYVFPSIPKELLKSVAFSQSH
jgi:hypothetical protein